MLLTPSALLHAARLHVRSQSFLILSALCWALACCGGNAKAHSRPRIEARGGVVLVNTRPTVHFAVANGSAAPAERAALVAGRLQALSAQGLSPGLVQPRHEGRNWRIVLAGRGLLLYITRADARAAHSAPGALANHWAAQIRSALLLPAVLLKPARLVVPVGGTRTLAIGGYATGDVSVNSSAADSPVATWKNSGRRVIVHGEKPGKSIARIQVGDETAQCVVVVKKWAGRVPTDLTAEVTGTPGAPPDLIMQAAQEVLRRAPREPGAVLRLLTPLKTRRITRPGQSQTLSCQIVLRGGDYLPVTGMARVRVFNRALPPRQAAQLLYSNSPEHIRKPQTLYAAQLTGDAPARVMFHHDNQTHGPVVLAVTLTNPTDKPVRVHLMPGFVQPGGGPATIGYYAGRVFLHNWMRGRGEICTLLPGHVLPISLQRLERHCTASGIAQVELLDADAATRCLLRVAAVPTGATGFPRSAQKHLDAWRYADARPMTASEQEDVRGFDGPTTVYRAARTLQADYTIGQRWAFVPLGRPLADPLQKPDEDIRGNTGDYGVLYDIRVKICNPLPHSRKVEFVFGPGGGPAMAVCAIGGQYCEVGETRPPIQRPLASITLRPNETRIVTIHTVPLGGSTYPANMIVR